MLCPRVSRTVTGLKSMSQGYGEIGDVFSKVLGDMIAVYQHVQDDRKSEWLIWCQCKENVSSVFSLHYIMSPCFIFQNLPWTLPQDVTLSSLISCRTFLIIIVVSQMPFFYLTFTRNAPPPQHLVSLQIRNLLRSYEINKVWKDRYGEIRLTPLLLGSEPMNKIKYEGLEVKFMGTFPTKKDLKSHGLP